MKQNHLMAVACCFAVFFALPGFCQNTGWGSVDFRLLMILHPEMQTFDYANGRFFRSDFSGKTAIELREELDKAHQSSQPMLAKLIKSRENLISQRSQTFLNRERTLQRIFNPQTDIEYQVKKKIIKARQKVVKFDNERLLKDGPKEDDLPLPLSPEEQRQARGELEEVFTKQIASFDAELILIQDQVKAVQETIYSPVYMTTPETQEKLSKIKKEITDLVSRVAKEQKIGIVMDSTFGAKPVQKAGDVTTLPLQPDTPDIISSSLFHSFANWKLMDNPPPRSDGTMVPPEHGSGAMHANKIQEFKKYLEYRHYISDAVSGFNPGKIFLTGGTDLTQAVAQKILVAYSIPEPLRKTYLEIVKEFCGFEALNYMAPEIKFPK